MNNRWRNWRKANDMVWDAGLKETVLIRREDLNGAMEVRFVYKEEIEELREKYGERLKIEFPKEG